jgi:hypothetical protein
MSDSNKIVGKRKDLRPKKLEDYPQKGSRKDVFKSLKKAVKSPKSSR